MPDFFGVYDNMKVWEYLDFFAAAYKVPQDKRRTMIGDLLALVDLSAKRDAFVEELSRGMKQRLCLARTLVHEPDLLILDEPASGLDPHARIELRELLKELRSLGKTILISSHILTELAEMCTHVAIIERGRLLVSGGVNDILQAMQPAREIYVRVLSRSLRRGEYHQHCARRAWCASLPARLPARAGRGRRNDGALHRLFQRPSRPLIPPSRLLPARSHRLLQPSSPTARQP